MKQKIITKAVWILSIVSLFTDIASEMLYPVMPLYLKSIGFSVVLIGLLEGFVEAVAGFSKGYFGNLSDQMGKRVPFVRSGYFLSALSKPMMALLTFPLWIFFSRTIDRIGKGVRTSARDALLSEESTKENKGKVFGFHRGMDTLGATIGPILALIWLYCNPGSYKVLFFLAFIPGIIAVALTYLIRERKKEVDFKKTEYSFFTFLKYWTKSSSSYKKLIVGLLAFSLFNSSDIFLLLMVKANGFSDYELILIYIFYNMVYAFFSYPLGSLGDNIGLRKTYLIGLLLFIIVYAGMAFNQQHYTYYALFFIYGIYAACTEGISKALISNMADKENVATAIGFYTSFNSIMAIAASSIAGLIWYNYSPGIAFIFSAVGVLSVFLYFVTLKVKGTRAS